MSRNDEYRANSTGSENGMKKMRKDDIKTEQNTDDVIFARPTFNFNSGSSMFQPNQENSSGINQQIPELSNNQIRDVIFGNPALKNDPDAEMKYQPNCSGFSQQQAGMVLNRPEGSGNVSHGVNANGFGGNLIVKHLSL